MKLALKIVGGVLLALVIIVIAAYGYLGGFTTITIEEKPMGPYHFAFRELGTTDFSKVGQSTTKLQQDLLSKGVPPRHPFDVFYPDGGGKIGFLIAESDTARLPSLDSSITVETLAAQQCMVAEFPWKNSMSFMVGFIKIDPALQSYREKHGYRKTWAATIHDRNTITYLQPIIRELIAPH